MAIWSYLNLLHLTLIIATTALVLTYPTRQEQIYKNVALGLGNWFILLAAFRLISPLLYQFQRDIYLLHPIQWPEGKYLYIICFLCADLTNFTNHYLSHQFRWLWKIHRLHHIPLNVDLSVHWRQHFLASLFLMSLLILSSIIFNLNVNIVLLSSLLLSIYQLPLHLERFRYFAVLNKFFITPQAHRIHHDKRFFDKNLGSFFSIYDRIMRSYQEPLNE